MTPPPGALPSLKRFERQARFFYLNSHESIDIFAFFGQSSPLLFPIWSFHVTQKKRFQLTFDKHLPPEIRMPILALVRHLETYDDLIPFVSWDSPQARLDFIAMIDSAGGFKPVPTMVRTIAKALYKELDRVMERDQNRGVSIVQHQRHCRRFDGWMNDLIDQLGRADRYLSRMALEDAARTTLTHNMTRDIAFAGIHTYVQDVFKGAGRAEEHENASWLAQWFLFAELLAGAAIPARIRSHVDPSIDWRQAFSFLRETDLTPCHQIPFSIPFRSGITPFRTTGNLSVERDMDPLYIARMDVFLTFDDKRYHLGAALSRVNGELLMLPSRFTDPTEIFTSRNAMPALAALREAMILALFDALATGHIREQAWLPSSAFSELFPVEPPQAPVPEASPLPAPSEEVAERTPSPNALLTRQNVITFEELEALNGKAPTQPRRVILRTRQLTWRRIIAALGRCGVRVEAGGKHVKLVLGNKSHAFLNPHDQETRKNVWVLKEVLETFEISHERFYAAL